MYISLTEMQLEKRNETVWAIKRKEDPGRFLLRAVEQKGKIIEISIGLQKKEQEIYFNMSTREFYDFLEIIHNFQQFIENPNTEPQWMKPAPLSLDGQGPPLAHPREPQENQYSLEGKKKESSKIEDEIDESLASLESLDRGLLTTENSSPSKIHSQYNTAQNKKKITAPVVNPGKIKSDEEQMRELLEIAEKAVAKQENRLSEPSIPKNTSKITSNSGSNTTSIKQTVSNKDSDTNNSITHKKLKETDWDPW